MNRLARTLAMAAVAGGLTSVATAQSLTTLYASNNNNAAGGTIFFDLTVGPSNITLTSMDCNLGPQTGTFGFTLYTKIGTYAGSEQNAGAWTTATTGTINGTGANLPSPATFGGAVVLSAGTTYGIAIALADTGQTSASHYYTNGTGANQAYSNADLSLALGAAQNALFTGAPFTPRVWNGTVHYSLGGTLGACCLTSGATNCIQTTSANCTAQGGTYAGDNVTCAAANCAPLPTGACCNPASGCSITTQFACVGGGGTYAGNNVTCAAANCPPISVWSEQGDAGDLPGTAQVTGGSGSMTQIRGSFTAGDVDMFQINICDAANFSATTVGLTTLDTQLWVFKADGTGVVVNDDATGLQSTLTSLRVAPLGNGLYYLANSIFNRDAAGATTGGLIWNTNNPEPSPDGPAAAEPIGSWLNTTTATGNYAIGLTGTCFVGGNFGACCLGAPSYACTVTDAASCASQGGTYAGNGVTCATANCPPPPTGSCCFFNGTCQVLTQVQCGTQGGVYGGNSTPCGSCPTPYAESGDAGDLPATAAVVSGSGTLVGITGTLGTDDADMYRIRICDAANFNASTRTLTTVDTQLFIFRPDGTGVVVNDDAVAPATGLQSTISSLLIAPAGNGEYYLAVSQWDKDPLGATTSGEIWLDQPFASERAPDGPAAAEPVGSWSATTTVGGAYGIRLAGACYIGGTTCYADCDGVGGLTANDFACFLLAYTNNASYADCDGVGGLTANDFACFLLRYTNGCS